MYQRLLEAYLTHYQPRLKAELMEAGTLQVHLQSQNEAMLEARNQILEQLEVKHPTMSQQQRKAEADQIVRELFLKIPT